MRDYLRRWPQPRTSRRSRRWHRPSCSPRSGHACWSLPVITPTVPIPTSSPSEHVRRARASCSVRTSCSPPSSPSCSKPIRSEARRLARLHTGSFYLSAANYVRCAALARLERRRPRRRRLRRAGRRDRRVGRRAGDRRAASGEYLDAGADHVCVQPVTAIRPLVDGPDTAALDVLRRLAPVVTALGRVDSRAGRDTAAAIHIRSSRSAARTVDGEGDWA